RLRTATPASAPLSETLRQCEGLVSMQVMAKYGYEGLFLVLFLEAIGIPIPGALALLIAGAACATGHMRLGIALAVSIAAMLAGDTLLYMVGRKTGWHLL